MRTIHKQNSLLGASALIGVSVVSVLAFVSLPTMSWPLLFATFCFSISIPALGSYIFMISGETEPIPFDVPFMILLIGGCLSSLVGFGAIVFHLHRTAGYVFIASVVLTLMLIGASKIGGSNPE